MNLRRLSSIVVTASLLATSAVAQATTTNTGQLGVAPNSGDPFSQTVNNAGVIDLTGSATGGGLFGDSMGSGTLHLDYGVVQLQGTFSGDGYTFARGIWRDDVVFTSPGVPAGTSATVTYSLSLDGLLQINPNGGGAAASYLLQASLGGAFSINKSGSINSLNGGMFTGDPFGTYTATVTVQIGFPAQLDVELSGSAQPGYGGGSFDNPEADFSLDSLHWDGISDVSVDGVSVPFTAIGASGTNYAEPVYP